MATKTTKLTAPKGVATSTAVVAAAEAPTALVPVHRASRAACARVREALPLTAKELDTIPAAMGIKRTDKPNDCRPGLRYNMVEAIASCATVKDFESLRVFGRPGSKHDSTPFVPKRVDLGFMLTNGFMSLVK